MDPITMGLLYGASIALRELARRPEVKAIEDTIDDALEARKEKKREEAERLRKEREALQKKKEAEGRVTIRVHCNVCDSRYNRWIGAVGCPRCGADERYVSRIS